MQWFGESWGAPVCALIDHVPVPVGELCIECKDGITESDAGFIIPYLEFEKRGFTNTFFHRDCFLDSILGKERSRNFRPGENL